MIVLGGILGVVFTPTEAAGLAVIYILVLGVVYRSLTWPALRTVITSTAETTGAILLIVASASLFGWVLARERIPQTVAEGILSLTDHPIVFLILVNLLLLLIGTMLEPTGAILIMVPVLLPVVTTFGIDPLHWPWSRSSRRSACGCRAWWGSVEIGGRGETLAPGAGPRHVAGRQSGSVAASSTS